MKVVQPSLEYRSRLGRWLAGRETIDQPAERAVHVKTHPWWQVIWLTGVDYKLHFPAAGRSLCEETPQADLSPT